MVSDGLPDWGPAGHAESIDAGCVPVGPYWVPASWRVDGESYRRSVRLVAEHLLSRPDHGAGVYVPKTLDELEPMLALWPHVLVLPTTRALSIDDLVVGRAFPVHPLGVVTKPTWADGRWCSPAEFFFHDLDHARFKVREDLRALGVTIPDAYRDGSTIDPATGRHRVILAAARDLVSGELWRIADERAALARRLLAAIAAETGDLGAAARWLLFELVHEKSLPLDPLVLRRELSTTVHVEKLRAKCRQGFYARHAPDAAVVDQLEAARRWLRNACARETPGPLVR